MKRQVPVLILTVIIFLAAASRLYGLANNPAGMTDDEAENGYDAFSILKTGKDQWGKSWLSTTFRGFGDYRLPAYTYLTVPSVKAFGLTPFAVRLPSAIAGILTVIAVYFLTGELFGDKKVALLSSFFLAISPWHIALSRVAIEQVISVLCITTALYFMLRGKKNKKFIITSGILFGLSLFIYRPNLLLAPFLFVSTIWLFRRDYKGKSKYIAAGLAVFFILAIPILISVSANGIGARANQVNLTNDSGLVDNVNEKRGACQLMVPQAICKVVFNKYEAFGVKFVENYFHHFSPNLLALHGTPTQYGVLPLRGLVYLFEYPLILIGVYLFMSRPTPGRMLVLAMLLFSPLPDSSTSDGHFGRFFISFPTWPILTAAAVMQAGRYRSLIIGGFLVGFAMFIVEYWTYFPVRYSMYSHYGYRQLVGEVTKEQPHYDRILISSAVNDSKQYIFYLWYTGYDPATFQSGAGIKKEVDSKGWVRVRTIENIEFVPELSRFDNGAEYDPRVLYVGSPKEFPKDGVPDPVFVIRDKKGDILFQAVP